MDEMEPTSLDIGFFAAGALGFFLIAGGVITTCAASIVGGFLLMALVLAYFAVTSESV